ncbi:MAG: GHKL domain-containing protein [Balneolaceae bacterium]|nr:MAG: GHKL domain-containing protein [Balneolaceae bacterium]
MKIFKKFLKIAPNRITLTVLLISLMITQIIAYKIYETEKKNEYLIVQQEINHLKNKLEESLSHSVTATKMLAYLITHDLLGSHFERISEELLEQNKFIDAIQYVQGDQIINTYPIVGNEPTIGYDVLENPIHRREAMLALERGDLYFEGPFSLIQGGRGIVGRYPITINNEYWGFSAVVIRYETLLNAINVDSSGINDTFIYQMVKYSDEQSPNYFFSHTEPYDRGVYYSSFVPFGNWHIYAKLKNPSYNRIGILFSTIGILFSFLLAIFMWYLADEPHRLTALVDKKTEDLDTSNKKLEEYTYQLMMKKRELEQMAYVTSHDLQEPLRMITSFLTQLKKKYGNQLDEKAHQYIYFAVDGAEKMRQIILDLLDYSKVGRMDTELVKIDTNQLIKKLISQKKKSIEELNAIIEIGELPEIEADKAEFEIVFEELLDNALKFHSPGNSPIIKIEAITRDNDWLFSINDNGVGISEKYRKKIFEIFQRLHSREELKGTGMGLALCKKIIGNYRGQIWVESGDGKGSTFYFTILKSEK